MKKQISRTIYLISAVLIIAGISFTSCKKDNTVTVDKSALADSLTVTNALLSNSVEGIAAGQYQRGSKAVLQSTITAIQPIYDDPASTQAQINSAIANLNAAVLLFKSKAIVPIAQQNLVAQWTFSEGTGTTVTDLSSNHLVALLWQDIRLLSDEVRFLHGQRIDMELLTRPFIS